MNIHYMQSKIAQPVPIGNGYRIPPRGQLRVTFFKGYSFF